MLNPKYLFILTSLFAISTSAFANLNDGILRDENGNVRHMSQDAAAAACAAVGKRLPSIRELALESQALGAIGILKNPDGTEVSRRQVESGSAKLPANSVLVSFPVSSGKAKKVDEFYYHYSNFQNLTGDARHEWFWSSSIDSSAANKAWDLNAALGSIASNPRIDDLDAVRCINR